MGAWVFYKLGDWLSDAVNLNIPGTYATYQWLMRCSVWCQGTMKRGPWEYAEQDWVEITGDDE
jgi:hypothetical protein